MAGAGNQFDLSDVKDEKPTLAELEAKSAESGLAALSERHVPDFERARDGAEAVSMAKAEAAAEAGAHARETAEQAVRLENRYDTTFNDEERRTLAEMTAAYNALATAISLKLDGIDALAETDEKGEKEHGAENMEEAAPANEPDEEEALTPVAAMSEAELNKEWDRLSAIIAEEGEEEAAAMKEALRSGVMPEPSEAGKRLNDVYRRLQELRAMPKKAPGEAPIELAAEMRKEPKETPPPPPGSPDRARWERDIQPVMERISAGLAVGAEHLPETVKKRAGEGRLDELASHFRELSAAMRNGTDDDARAKLVETGFITADEASKFTPAGVTRLRTKVFAHAEKALGLIEQAQNAASPEATQKPEEQLIDWMEVEEWQEGLKKREEVAKELEKRGGIIDWTEVGEEAAPASAAVGSPASTPPASNEPPPSVPAREPPPAYQRLQRMKGFIPNRVEPGTRAAMKASRPEPAAAPEPAAEPKTEDGSPERKKALKKLEHILPAKEQEAVFARAARNLLKRGKDGFKAFENHMQKLGDASVPESAKAVLVEQKFLTQEEADALEDGEIMEFRSAVLRQSEGVYQAAERVREKDRAQAFFRKAKENLGRFEEATEKGDAESAERLSEEQQALIDRLDDARSKELFSKLFEAGILLAEAKASGKRKKELAPLRDEYEKWRGIIEHEIDRLA